MKPYKLAMVVALLSTPAFAGAGTILPKSIPEVISICRPVIDEEYRGDTSHWGTCIKATADYLKLVYGPPPTVADPNSEDADLIYELAKLYRPGANCPIHRTELPDAIEKAASFSTDEKQRQLIIEIANTIAACQAIETGSVIPTTPNEVSPD
jgi:hypothetical protein